MNVQESHERTEGYSMRKYGPKDASHPSIGEECPACKFPFKEGDFTALIALGPGDNEEEKNKARVGRAYASIAVEVHWACATGEDL